MAPSPPRCSQCHGFDVRPSRLRRWNHLLHLLTLRWLRPYRCVRCGKRFWRFG